MSLKPQPGPQTEFLQCTADIVFYGGSAGGGKTFALLLEAGRNYRVKNFTAVIFRRSSTQIRGGGGLWDESADIYTALGAKPYVSDTTWKWAKYKSKVIMTHLQHEKTKYDHQGLQYQLICWDEITHFSESMFWYMLSRNRAGACEGVQPYVRATCNPDARSWVKRFLAPWVDSKYKGKKAQSGEIRQFYRFGGEVIWLEDDEAVAAAKSAGHLPKTCTFIRSSIYDNKILMDRDKQYLGNLMAQNAVERARLLDGSWDVDEQNKFFEIEKFNRIPICDVPPLKKIVRYWDLAATIPEENRRACYTAGVKVGIDYDNRVYILDVKRAQYKPDDVLNLVVETAELDGRDCHVWWEQEPGSASIAMRAVYIRALVGYVANSDRVTGNKITRSSPLQSALSNNNVYLVRGPWNAAFLDECDTYPNGFKDQIDAASGGLSKVVEENEFVFA